MKRALTPVLLALFMIFNLGLLGALFLDFSSSVPAGATAGKVSPAGRAVADTGSIATVVEVDTSVFVGEPFGYEVRVRYDPEAVDPDFRKFLRDVRFVPFEQLHLSRPTIVESTLPSGEREFLLSYKILGVNVIPHGSYTVDPVKLSYRDLAADKIKTIAVQPEAVQIAGYYPRDFFGIPFQPLKGTIETFHEEKMAAIAVDAILFLSLGGFLIYNAARKREIRVASGADAIREQYETVEAGSGSKRQRILVYEKLFLSLLLRYRGLSARGFWLGRMQLAEPYWDGNLRGMRQDFQAAYRGREPGKGVISSIRERFEGAFRQLEPESAGERLAELERVQGTAGQRMLKHKVSLAGGAASLLFAAFFFVMLLKPDAWRNDDAVFFNEWINLLPEKFFDGSRNDDLESVDLELMGHASEQHKTMEKLEGEEYKAAYLYNYGTIVAKTNVAILTSAGEAEEMEEDESVEPPSFEFPVQLLANAVRFYPYDEDARRNLELAIMYRENEDKNETGEVQGEVGPPLPGFSRDMNEVLF